MNPTINKSDFEDLTTNLRDLAYSYLEKFFGWVAGSRTPITRSKILRLTIRRQPKSGTPKENRTPISRLKTLSPNR